MPQDGIFTFVKEETVYLIIVGWKVFVWLHAVFASLFTQKNKKYFTTLQLLQGHS